MNYFTINLNRFTGSYPWLNQIVFQNCQFDTLICHKHKQIKLLNCTQYSAVKEKINIRNEYEDK